MQKSRPADIPLTVTDIKQYIYCPRVVYYTYVMPLIRPTTGKMDMGKEDHQKVSQLEKRRSLKSYRLVEGERRFNLRLYSARLGLSGTLDMAIFTKGEIIPVEMKFSTKRPSLNHKYQLTAYAMLIEDTYNRAVRRGFIHLIPVKKSFEIEITPNMRRLVKKMLENIRSMILAEAMPMPTRYRKRCVDCEYLKFCSDIDISQVPSSAAPA